EAHTHEGEGLERGPRRGHHRRRLGEERLMPKKSPFDAVETRLKEYALRFPGAVEEHPWGHIAIKVKKKMFFVIGGTDERKSVTVKLPSSGRMALLLPFTAPTGYGLGKSGWIT